MWPRKQIDIGWADLAFALAQTYRSPDPAVLECAVRDAWPSGRHVLTALSVRSAFDLLWRVLPLRPADEVVFSAITIPDMVRIAREWGLTAVPVPIDPATMAPCVEDVRRAITERTRAVVITHLFGGRCDLAPFVDLAREQGVLLVEDCAQAFAGSHYHGDPGADVSLFSFGSIKTATALGGAIVVVRDSDLARRMARAQDTYPRQPTGEFRRRVVKYVALKLASARPLFRAICWGMDVAGRDYDRWFNGLVRGFPGPDFYSRIRRRPCPALLALLNRRLRQPIDAAIEARVMRGRAIEAGLTFAEAALADRDSHRTYWVFPVRTRDPRGLITRLRTAGFDATQGQSLGVVTPSAPVTLDSMKATHELLDQLVFVPCYANLPMSEAKRLGAVLAARRVERALQKTERGGRGAGLKTFKTASRTVSPKHTGDFRS
jgi:dTDP-4-amino-4,6-dideoxygalactose transaminase